MLNTFDHVFGDIVLHHGMKLLLWSAEANRHVARDKFGAHDFCKAKSARALFRSTHGRSTKNDPVRKISHRHDCMHAVGSHRFRALLFRKDTCSSCRYLQVRVPKPRCQLSSGPRLPPGSSSCGKPPSEAATTQDSSTSRL